MIIYFKIKDGPTNVSVVSKNDQIIVGTEEELSCIVSCGNPSNYAYKWFNDSSDISLSNSSTYNVLSDEIREVNITCCAWNGFGSEKCGSKVFNLISKSS